MTARERSISRIRTTFTHIRLRRREKKSLIRRSFVSWKEQKFFFAIRARDSGLDAVNILCKPISNTISLCLMHRTAQPSRLACLAFNWWLYLAHSFYCQLNNWIKAKNSDWLCSSLFLTVAAGHTSFQRVHVDFCIEVIRGDDDDHCARETRIKVYTKRRQRNHGNCARLCRANKFVITCASLRFYKSFINMMSVISTRLRLLLEFASSGSESASECERGFYFFSSETTDLWNFLLNPHTRKLNSWGRATLILLAAEKSWRIGEIN